MKTGAARSANKYHVFVQVDPGTEWVKHTCYAEYPQAYEALCLCDDIHAAQIIDMDLCIRLYTRGI